jgi:hypothetical protein
MLKTNRITTNIKTPTAGNTLRGDVMKYKYVSLGALIACCCGFSAAFSQTPNQPSLPVEAWMTHPWTASDAPYKAIEVSLKTQFANSADPTCLALPFQKRAELHPRDAEIQFTWGLLALMLSQRPGGNIIGIYGHGDLARLESADPLNVHEYTRIRFAVDSMLYKDKDLYIVGNRLLAYNPGDKAVYDDQINALSFNTHFDEALRLAQQLVARNPEDASAHTFVGGVYEDMWIHYQDKRCAQAAMLEYQKYLKLASPNDSFRKMAENLVAVFRKDSQ